MAKHKPEKKPTKWQAYGVPLHGSKHVMDTKSVTKLTWSDCVADQTPQVYNANMGGGDTRIIREMAKLKMRQIVAVPKQAALLADTPKVLNTPPNNAYLPAKMALPHFLPTTAPCSSLCSSPYSAALSTFGLGFSFT